MRLRERRRVRVCWDLVTSAGSSIALRRGDAEKAHTALAHAERARVPAHDDLPAADLEAERLVFCGVAIKLLPECAIAEEPAGVAHLDRVAALDDVARAQDEICT